MKNNKIKKKGFISYETLINNLNQVIKQQTKEKELGIKWLKGSDSP
jgi:hypothetical protein